MEGGLTLHEKRKTSNKTVTGKGRAVGFTLAYKLRAVFFSFITFVLMPANAGQDYRENCRKFINTIYKRVVKSKQIVNIGNYWNSLLILSL